MAKISTYPSVGTPTLSDMLIGTDAADSNATKNFTISSIVALANLGQFVPYTGATGDVNLGTYGIRLPFIQSGASSNTIETIDATSNGVGLLIDNNNGYYRLGDYNSIYSGTYIAIDDNFGRVILQGSLYVNGSDGSAGQFLQSNGIGGVPSWGTPPAATLNAVLAAGNTSALDAKVGSLFIKDGSAITYSKISSSLSGAISFINASNSSFFVVDSTQLAFGAFARFDNSLLTAQRTYDLPDNAGTLVLSVNGTVPDTAGNVTLTVSGGWGLTGNAGTNPATDFVGTTDNQDLVLKANNVEFIRLDTATSKVYSNDILAENSGASSIKVASTTGWGFAEIAQDNMIGSGYLRLNNGVASATIGSLNILQARAIQVPNDDGTLVMTVNGTYADATGNVTIAESYLIYTALLNFDGTTASATVLKNTLGVTINWSNPINGIIRGTAASGTPFTLNKTWISNGGYWGGSGPFIVTSSPSTPFLDTRVDFRFYLHDGTLSFTPNISDFPIEIRVYP